MARNKKIKYFNVPDCRHLIFWRSSSEGQHTRVVYTKPTLRVAQRVFSLNDH